MMNMHFCLSIWSGLAGITLYLSACVCVYLHMYDARMNHVWYMNRISVSANVMCCWFIHANNPAGRNSVEVIAQ